MKLDEGITDQRLSLDVTPLIDVVFLLVLFFAVSTSFISAEDLESLKDTLVGLAVDKEKLKGRLGHQNAQLARLGLEIEVLQTDYDAMLERKTAELKELAAEVERVEGERAKAEWMIQALETEKVSLQETLREADAARAGLQEQLEQAFRDYQALGLELHNVQGERDAQARTEQLLMALFEERAAEAEELTADLEKAASEREALAGKVTDLESALGDAQTARRMLAAALAERQGDLDNRALELEVLRNRVARLTRDLRRYQEVSKLDQTEIARLASARASLSHGLAQYLRDQHLEIEQEQHKLVVKLSDRVLFDSGDTALKPSGLEVLRSVGRILKERLGDLSVQIGGHTDDVPVRDGANPAGASWRTNWGLSAARAVNVVRFLETEVGIDPSRLSAVGYGEHRPVAGNDTSQGRARNRRIEVVLLPPPRSQSGIASQHPRPRASQENRSPSS